MNRFYSLNRSMSVRATDRFPYLLCFSKSCNIFSKESKAGKELTLENGYNETKDDFGLQYKERGLLSSKTTTIKSRDESKTVTAATLSGDAVQITAGGNTNVTGSNVIGTHDFALGGLNYILK